MRLFFTLIISVIIFNKTVGLNQDSFNKTNIYREASSKYLINIEYQNMRSTHATYFNGGSLIYNLKVTESFYTGLGAEFSYARFHHDNEWNLYKLKFLPVFFDFKFNLLKGNITPFFHTSEGISFNRYKRESIFELGKYNNYSEKGFFVYAGLGVSIRLYNFLNSIIELGFKGYHMSFNDMDINPHGTTIRVGLSFNY